MTSNTKKRTNRSKKTSKKRGGVFRWLKRAIGLNKDTMVTFSEDLSNSLVVEAKIPGRIGKTANTIKLQIGDYFAREGWTGDYYGKVIDWTYAGDKKAENIQSMIYIKVRPVYNTRDISIATKSLQLKTTNWKASIKNCKDDIEFPSEHPYMINLNVGSSSLTGKQGIEHLEAKATDLNFWQNIQSPIEKNGKEIIPANPVNDDDKLYVLTITELNDQQKAKEKLETTYVSTYATKTEFDDIIKQLGDRKDKIDETFKNAIKNYDNKRKTSKSHSPPPPPPPPPPLPPPPSNHQCMDIIKKFIDKHSITDTNQIDPSEIENFIQKHKFTYPELNHCLKSLGLKPVSVPSGH